MKREEKTAIYIILIVNKTAKWKTRKFFTN